MDPPDLINEDDDVVFFDALDYDWPSGLDSSESSASSSTSSLSDSPAVYDDSRHSSLVDIIRRRPTRRGSFGRGTKDGLNSSIGSESDLINKARLSFIKQQSFKKPTNLNEILDECGIEKCDSIEEQVESSTATNEPGKENDEESTVTAAPANDDAVDAMAESGAEAGVSSLICHTADNIVAYSNAEAGVSSPICLTDDDITDSDAEAGIPSPNFLECIARLVIKAIGFQIHMFVMFTTYPLLFLYHSCMLFISPLRTITMGKQILMGILSKAWNTFCDFIGPPIHQLFGNRKSIGKVALRYGWGFLWSIYVCLFLVVLLLWSLATSGFMMRSFMEKPIHRRENLNFDYTKQTPVAYMPLISCAGLGNDIDSEHNVKAGNWIGARIIPPRHKVQVTVSLLVPESEYNRNLGIFQVRVDFLSLNGRNIASSSQPYMLRFKSEPIRLVLTFLKMAPLLAGYISETQTLDVKIRGFIEKDDVPTSCLKVTLEHRAEYRPGAGIPELYDASLILESELPLLKRIMWQWKMSIFIWTTMVAFIFEVLLFLLCCRPMIFPRIRRSAGSSSRTTTENNLPAES